MFWTIVGALAFFFLGIPLILACITSKDFWRLVGTLTIIGLFAAAVIWANRNEPDAKMRSERRAP